MKAISFGGIVMALVLSIGPLASAQAPPWSISMFAGYKYLEMGEYSFSHNTHPDDSFLPGASTPGSAGVTHLDGGLNLGDFGVRYQTPISKSFSFNVDLGGLGGGERVQQKNANDPRPDANAAFVYSEARWGALGALGVSYYIHQFYMGAEAQCSGIIIDSGWNRYGSDQSQHMGIRLVPSVGPKIGYQFSDSASIESTLQFGNSIGFGIQTVFKFW